MNHWNVWIHLNKGVPDPKLIQVQACDVDGAIVGARYRLRLLFGLKRSEYTVLGVMEVSCLKEIA